MSPEGILAEHGETLQYVVYFGLLAGLGAIETLAPRREECQDRRASSLGWLLGLPFRHRIERLQEGA